jgi:hypothetical protein
MNPVAFTNRYMHVVVSGVDMIAANDSGLVALFLSWEREREMVQQADNDSDVD